MENILMKRNMATFIRNNIEVDAVRSVGFRVAINLPRPKCSSEIGEVFSYLNVKKVYESNCALSSRYMEDYLKISNMTDLVLAVEENDADLGIAFDPAVERSSFICEDGVFFMQDREVIELASSFKKGNIDPYCGLSTAILVLGLLAETGLKASVFKARYPALHRMSERVILREKEFLMLVNDLRQTFCRDFSAKDNCSIQIASQGKRAELKYDVSSKTLLLMVEGISYNRVNRFMNQLLAKTKIYFNMEMRLK